MDTVIHHYYYCHCRYQCHHDMYRDLIAAHSLWSFIVDVIDLIMLFIEIVPVLPINRKLTERLYCSTRFCSVLYDTLLYYTIILYYTYCIVTYSRCLPHHGTGIQHEVNSINCCILFAQFFSKRRHSLRLFQLSLEE